jgi:tripeptidyl-peptidase-1
MMKTAVTFALLVALIATASAALTMSENHALRADWTRVTKAPMLHEHELVFVVKQKNLEKLEQILMLVSHPKLQSFGKHLSFDEVGTLTENREASEAVKSFLHDNGARVTEVSKYGEFITATASIGLWNKLLNADFHVYRHDEKQKLIFRTHAYDIPSDLEAHLDFVAYANHLPPRMFGVPIRSDVNVSVAANSVTPSLLNSFFHVDSNKGSQKTSEGVFESLNQNVNPNDLKTFESDFSIPSEAITTDVGGHASTLGCLLNPNNCAEANLDVEYMMAEAQNIPFTYFYESNQQEPYLTFAQAVAQESNPAKVYSISYGSIESDVSSSIKTSFDTAAKKLGTMGTSVFVSSGDDGVAGFQARGNTGACGYNPSFPATSPYVTAVGATMGIETNTAEIACASSTGGLITTGGGFSTFYSQPSYQSSAVSHYFSTAKAPLGSGYAKQNRGYPDISMPGHNYIVVINNNQYQVSGTSASSPVAASFFALINSKRADAGKSSLGFLNQIIYSTLSTAGVYNDITSGLNNCAAAQSNPTCCTGQGFYAAAGWDPLTGLGTVDFAKLEQALANL